MRLEKLSSEQEALLPVVRDEWLQIGLATGPADREAAEAGVRVAYEAAGLQPPSIVIWLDSPMAGQIGDEVGDQVRGQVWDQVGDQVRGQVGDQVGDQVRDQVWDQVGDQVRDQVRFSAWGQHDAGWLAWCQAFAQLGIAEAERTNGLAQVARASGWWWPRQGAVILTERPTLLRRDDEGRLHNETGPALMYPDGWGIWASHGVRVPRQVIEAPESLNAEAILGESNAEVRRVMIERFGAGRLMTEANGLLVDEDLDELGHPRRLWRLDLRDDPEPLVMVELVNSTPEPDGEFRRYMLRVPPGTRSALEGVAWTWGDAPADYRLVAQS